MTKVNKKRYVVICTDRRGVFGGWLESGGIGKVVLTEARQCLYWPSGGVPGLAANGPLDGCRVSTAAPRLEDTAHAVMDCSDEAQSRWIEFK